MIISNKTSRLSLGRMSNDESEGEQDVLREIQVNGDIDYIVEVNISKYHNFTSSDTHILILENRIK